MTFIATIKLGSELDKSLKADKFGQYEIDGNLFILLEEIYVCKKVCNLIPLLDFLDVSVVISTNKDIINGSSTISE